MEEVAEGDVNLNILKEYREKFPVLDDAETFVLVGR